MGLFGALFAGVAGLGSQSNKIGIVSNNISNVNTVGFKEGEAAFNTLVVPGSVSGTFSPGGVLGNNQQLVNQQGLVQATSSATDMAISGSGLFVVNTKADGTGDTEYTRAGSFTPDSNGNFVNSAGLYLQGLQVKTPALSLNPTSLSTVNVNQNATGSSVATNLISIQANFDATQTPLAGAGELATLSGDTTNQANTATDILVPTTGLSGNGLVRGDSLNIETGGTTTDSFTYGGFNIGRNVTTGAVGDGGYSLTTQTLTGGLTSVAAGTAATATSSSLNGIDITSKTTDAVTNGPFKAGNLVVDGVTVTIADGDTLNNIATKISTALGGGSTATVTGNPGNYSIVIDDTGASGSAGTGAGINITGSSAIPNSATMSSSGPYALGDDSTITLTLPTAGTAGDFTVGSSAYIDGLTASVGGIAASSLNGQDLTVASVNTTNNTVTLKLPSGVTSTTAANGAGGTAIRVTNTTYPFAGNILDASNAADDFLGKSGSSEFSSTALSFSATVGGTSYSFNYNSSPNTTTGQFNSLDTLATAINNSTGGALTASVVNNQLYVSSTNPDQSVTFKNGNDTTATSNGVTAYGINWVQQLDLQNIPAAGTDEHRFNSLQSLANQINTVDPTNITATVNNPSGIATVDIDATDPQSTINFSDNTANTGQSIVEALGFKGVGNNALDQETMTNVGATGYSTGTFTAKYSATDSRYDMSSGAVTPQFTKDITVYDSLGIGHTVAMNVAKLSSNKWAVEFTAVPATDVASKTNDGQIAAGVITFNGDGSLNSVTGDLLSGIVQGTGTSSAGINVAWKNGATSSSIQFNLGTTGKTDGITQYAGASDVSQAIQNGSPTGQLTGVSIDSSGFVTATFSNGQTQKLYQIPLASVNNPDGLESISGNAYKQTLGSGEISLSFAGQNGTGTITSSALEQSNVDLSTQLTDLIVAQQAYGANTRVLTVTSQLLQELNQIIQ